MLRFDEWMVSRTDQALGALWNGLGIRRIHVVRFSALCYLTAKAIGWSAEGFGWAAALFFLAFGLCAAVEEIRVRIYPIQTLELMIKAERFSVLARLVRGLTLLDVVVTTIGFVVGTSGLLMAARVTFSVFFWLSVYAVSGESKPRVRRPKTVAVATPAPSHG